MQVIYIIYLGVIVFGSSLYLLSYSYAYRFMNKNEFMKENFPKINGKNYSFYEIFEIQELFFLMFWQYSIFYKKNGRLPFYDKKYNVVLNNFSKEDLVIFIENNYGFLRFYSILSSFGLLLILSVIIYFFIFDF